MIVTGRRRVPLPPQEDRFREISSRPRSAADRGPRQGSSHPPPPYPPSAQYQTQAPEPRFPQSYAFPGTFSSNHPPVRGDNVSRREMHPDGAGIKSDKEISQVDRHTSTTRHPPPLIPAEPMDIEVGERVASSRIPPSSSIHSPMDDIAKPGSVIFGGEAPRGPKALSSTNPGIPGPEPTSIVPMIPHIGSRGSRISERGRSPQADVLNRGSQDSRGLEVSRPSAARSDERHPPDGGYQVCLSCCHIPSELKLEIVAMGASSLSRRFRSNSSCACFRYQLHTRWGEKGRRWEQQRSSWCCFCGCRLFDQCKSWTNG